MILRYTVLDAGSDKVVIGCGEKLVSGPVSREHDSLRDLLAGTVAILRGSSQVGIVFMDREGERHLNIRRLERGRIAVQVVWHPDRRFARTASNKELRLACGSTIWELRNQVLESCEAIMETPGTDGYQRQRGGREFPLELFEQLRAMDLRVRFEHGEVVLECCSERVRLKASSMGQLLSAAMALVEGKPKASVTFAADVGEYRLSLSRIEDHRVALEAVRWVHLGDTTDTSTVVFSCETRLGRFRRELLAAAGESAT